MMITSSGINDNDRYMLLLVEHSELDRNYAQPYVGDWLYSTWCDHMMVWVYEAKWKESQSKLPVHVFAGKVTYCCVQDVHFDFHSSFIMTH